MSNAPLGFSFGSQGLAGFNHHYGDCKHGGPGSQGGGSASGGGGSSNRRRPSPLPPPQFGHRHRATCHLRQRCATGRRLLRGRRTNLARRPLFLPGFRSAAVLRSRSGPNLGGLGVLAVVYPLLSFAISPFPFASWRPWRMSIRSRHLPFPLSPSHLGGFHFPGLFMPLPWRCTASSQGAVRAGSTPISVLVGSGNSLTTSGTEYRLRSTQGLS